MWKLSLNWFHGVGAILRHNQDPVGTPGLYLHNTTGLVLAGDETTVEYR